MRRRGAHRWCAPRKAERRRRMAEMKPEERFEVGDFVYHVDPKAKLLGREGHTRLCEVTDVLTQEELTLRTVVGRKVLSRVDSRYVRKVSIGEVTAHLDNAPLEFSGEMLSAGDAWLRKERQGAKADEGTEVR